MATVGFLVSRQVRKDLVRPGQSFFCQFTATPQPYIGCFSEMKATFAVCCRDYLRRPTRIFVPRAAIAVPSTPVINNFRQRIGRGRRSHGFLG